MRSLRRVLGSFSNLFICFVLLLSLTHLTLAGISVYKHKVLQEDEETGLRVAMWSKKATPSGHSDAVIRYDVKVKAVEEIKEDITIDVLMYYAKNEQGVESSDADPYLFPCPVTVSNSTELRHNKITLKKKHTSQKSADALPVNVSGIYYVYFKYCNVDESQSRSPVEINGHVVWKNPYGHLPGDQYYMMPVYGLLSLLYLGLAIVWFVLSAMHWRKLLMVQNCVAGVIALGMMESTTWYFVLKDYNINGQYQTGSVIVAILISTMKRTVSRLLVLVVSMGYGVVKASLGRETQFKVLFLGGAYFVFSGTLQIVQYENVEDGLTTMLVIPVALLDTFFYWWIFLSLFVTDDRLSKRRQLIKLRMYRRFWFVLLVSLILSIIMVIYQLFVVLTTDINDRWQIWWIWEAFWLFLYFGILACICFLWRPTENNTRYAYSQLPAEREASLELQPMQATVAKDMKHRGTATQDTAEVVTDKTGTVKDEDEIEIPIIPTFTLDLDDDDDVQPQNQKLD